MEEIGEGGEELGEELPGEEPVKEVKPFVEKIKYQIVGTSHDPIYQPTEDVSYIIKDDESIEEEILKCGTIVWDISLDPKQIPKAYAILKCKLPDVGLNWPKFRYVEKCFSVEYKKGRKDFWHKFVKFL